MKNSLALAVFLLGQISYFAWSFVTLSRDPNIQVLLNAAGFGLVLAKSAANVLNLTCAMILLPMCRTLLGKSFIRGHVWIAYSIVFWSVIHVKAHYYNFLKIAPLKGLTPEQLSISSVGITGLICTLSLFVITTSTTSRYRVFWWLHHIFVVFFASLLAHGSFCFITNDPGKPDKCRGGPAFYKWWLFSCVCYLFDRLYREYRGSRTTSISKIIHHPAKVMELQFQKPELVYKPGQYIYLKCPAISWMEWHPFTLTSCPQENHYSVHIRAVGPWTKALAAAFDGPSLPRIMIDGSYGSPCQDVFKYQAAVLIGAGIGVTPFASILKSIWYELKTRPLNKVYFYWICKNTQEFVWFQDLLKTFEEDNFEHILEINIYLTKPLCANEVKNIVLHDGLNGVDAITELHVATRYGRPIWSKEFERISRHKCKIAVVSCGPKTLSVDLAAQCKAFSVNGTVFEYFCEGFNQ